MKKEAPNEYRLPDGFFKSTDADGMFGMFLVPVEGAQVLVSVNVSKGETDHITMSIDSQTVSDKHVEAVKRVFWDDDELDDLFIFDVPAIVKLNSNTVHVKKRIHKWKTKIIS